MASKTAGDVLVETLIDWGVKVIFGIPGDGINGMIESLRRYQDDIRFIQTRHEEAAAFMACAYSKYTGELGCCLATSGPGGIHLLNGLYDAKLDGQSVLAITGLQFHDLLHSFTQQDVELDKLFMDVAVYNSRIMGPAHTRNVVEIACRTAIAYKGVSHVTMPVDIQDQLVKDGVRSKRNVPDHNRATHASMHILPRDEMLNQAAQILNEAKKPMILAGRGALDATRQLQALAERIGAPVAKALLGKGAMADASPYCIGGVGLLGTRPSQEALEECDALLIVGSAFPYIEFYPKPGQAKIVQIDRDPQRIGLRAPVDCPLVGDGAQGARCAAAAARVIARTANSSRRRSRGMKDWNKLLEERGTRDRQAHEAAGRRL